MTTLPKSPWLPDPATDVGGIFVRYAPRFTMCVRRVWLPAVGALTVTPVFVHSYEHYAENQRRASESLVAIEKLCVHAQPCSSLWCALLP